MLGLRIENRKAQKLGRACWLSTYKTIFCSSSIFSKSLSLVIRVKLFSIAWLAISRSEREKIKPFFSYFLFSEERILAVSFDVLRTSNSSRNEAAFSLIMNSYEESGEKFWDKIFSIKKILSGNEADELNSLIYKERKKQGFSI